MWLLSLRGGVMAFLGLSYFLRALHLPSELLNSLIKRWLVRRSASISFVLLCIVSNAPAGGRLSELPCWSCILGGLAWLLFVFRVDTISY